MNSTRISKFLVVLAFVAMTMTAVTPIAHAADEGGWGDFGGGSGDWGYADIYPSDYGYADIYPSDYGYADIYPDSNGYADIYPDQYGYADIYPDNNGYADIYPDNNGYADIYPNYDTTTPGYDYTETGYSDYYSENGYAYSTGGQTSWHATPMTITPPTYRPVTPSYPVYPTPVYPTPRPSPTTPSYVTNTTNTNTCLYNSCNTSYVDNSINGSFNTAPVYPVTPQPIIQYVQPYQAPYCSITIGQGYQTGMVYLSWTSTGATSAYITPSIGNVNVNGSTNVYAYGNAVYSLTVTGPGGTYTCRTQSYIAPLAPQSPYVSLSQIPYTGFDFGTFGNAMYWLALLSFAAAGAYLVVYYQGGALALAGNMLGGRTVSYSETVTETAPEHTEVEVAHEVAHEAPVALFNLPTMSATSTKDSMTVAHTADGVPRIVITRN